MAADFSFIDLIASVKHNSDIIFQALPRMLTDEFHLRLEKDDWQIPMLKLLKRGCLFRVKKLFAHLLEPD